MKPTIPPTIHTLTKHKPLGKQQSKKLSHSMQIGI